MSMKNRITITIYGNEKYIGIHTKTVMDADCYGSDEKKSKRLLAFKRRLGAINGVEKADVRKFEVSIERGDAFDWNEIIPLAMPIIAKFCRYDIYELRIEDQRPRHRYDDDGYQTGPLYNAPVDVGMVPNDPYAVEADVSKSIAA